MTARHTRAVLAAVCSIWSASASAGAPDAVEQTAPAETTAEPQPPQRKRVVVHGSALIRRGITWDLTITGGLRLWDGDESESVVWMGRARAGVLLYSEPTFLIAGISVQAGALGTPAVGLEVEAIDLWRGTWGQLGALGSDDGALITVAAGWALFGLEYQRRLSGDREGDHVLLLTLHVPIGVIRAALQPPPGVVPSR